MESREDIFTRGFLFMTDIEKVVEQLAMWLRKKFTIFPEDVMNMLIENGVISEENVQQVVESAQKKELDIRLPKVYITN
jgi:hypothetical protein